MRIYLASPTTQLQAEMMAGCDVLESFAIAARARWAVRYRPTWTSAMLDSGAYSEMTTGKPVDLGAYIEFAAEHAAGYDEIVNLDQISGDVGERVDRSAANLMRMRDAGLDPMPVYHQGEPWSVLADLASCGKVGLGFQRPIQGADAFLGGAFDRLPSTCRVHGFAMANARYTGRYPFASVDSATWMHEVNALLSVKGQGADAIEYLTPGEILRDIVIRKYRRIPMATAWAGARQTALFGREVA